MSANGNGGYLNGNGNGVITAASSEEAVGNDYARSYPTRRVDC